MIKAGWCKCAKHDFLIGTHQPGDEYKLVLYSPEADLTPDCAKYPHPGEVVAQGYNTGGQTLRGFVSGVTQAGGGYMGWAQDAVWPNSHIKARAGLIINASKGNRPILVVDFKAVVTSTAAEFRVELSKTGGALIIIP